MLQDALGAFLMEGGVGGVDEKVIHIDDEPSFGNHVTEGVFHKPLKGGRGVGKPKEHYGGFKESFVGNEGYLPLVAILDPYIVIPPSDIKFGEDFGISQLVYEIEDEGKGVGVVNGVFIDITVVLTGAESSIFLFHEEERRGLGGVRWTDFS